MRNDITDFTRLILKQTATTGETGTIPASDDHTDGTWLSTDLYVGEGLVNTTDNILYIRTDSGITEVELGGADSEILTAKVTIASADVQQLAATPQEIVAAVSGKAIEVISASGFMTFNTTAYTMFNKLSIIGSTATIAQLTDTELLKSTASRGVRFYQTDMARATTDSQLVADSNIVLTCDGNSTDGDSDIMVSIVYRLITV